MKYRHFTCLIIASVVLLTAHSSNSNAQWRGVKQPAQKVLRVLGQGYGPGYHWRCPGSNSDYYNPYSAHNSLLISQQGTPARGGVLPVDGNQSFVVPFSSYAPTPEAGVGFGRRPGAAIGRPLQPATNSENDFPTSERNAADSSYAEDLGLESSNDGSGAEADSDDDSALKFAPIQNQFQPAGYRQHTPPTIRSKSDWSLSDPFTGRTGN